MVCVKNGSADNIFLKKYKSHAAYNDFNLYFSKATMGDEITVKRIYLLNKATVFVIIGLNNTIT